MNGLDFESNALMRDCVGACLEVHKILGVGLLEKAYKFALSEELKIRGHIVEEEVPMSVVYKESEITNAFYADIVVDGTLIIELKSVKELTDAHHAQIYNYMRLSGIYLGILVNFNSSYLLKGLSRKYL